MPDSSLHTSADFSAGHAVVAVHCESVTEREARIISDEVGTYAADAAHRVALDLEQVHMLASAGIGAIITIHKNCQKAKGKLVVFNLRPELLQLLKMTKLHKLFTIADCRDKALKALGK
ncbi:MAG: STAS domain-containing protein [Planctomycetota bacterium]